MDEQDISSVLRAAVNPSLTSLTLCGYPVPIPPNGRKSLLPSQVVETVEELTIVNGGIDPLSLAIPFDRLRMLHLIRKDNVPIHQRMSGNEIFTLVTNMPVLETLVIDLGFHDTPEFVPSQYPSKPQALSNLRELHTRFSYFKNRLKFLASFSLPKLQSLTLEYTPTKSPQIEWSSFIQFLTNESVEERITHLSMRNLLPPTQSNVQHLVLADTVVVRLIHLKRLELHEAAAPAILRMLCARMSKAEILGFPSLEYLSMWNSSQLPEEDLEEFIERQCDETPGTPRAGVPPRDFSSNLRTVETFECGVSIETLNKITQVLKKSINKESGDGDTSGESSRDH